MDYYVYSSWHNFSVVAHRAPTEAAAREWVERQRAQWRANGGNVPAYRIYYNPCGARVAEYAQEVR